MKTRLFSTFDVQHENNKGFLDDLRKIKSLSKEKLSVLINSFPEFKDISIKIEKRKFFDDLQKKTDLSYNIISSVFDVTNFFLKRIDNDERILDDNILDWITELVDYKAFEKEYANIYELYFTLLREDIYPKFKQITSKTYYESGVLPSIKSIGTTLEMRAILDREIELGENVENYNPRIIDIVPIVSIKIGLDSGVPDEISFQVSQKKLDYLIGEFEAS